MVGVPQLPIQHNLRPDLPRVLVNVQVQVWAKNLKILGIKIGTKKWLHIAQMVLMSLCEVFTKIKQKYY
jgi:hypothetical protein